jgi:outer membrane protein OmpA-like peptidoglycan-associated protein
MADGLGADTLRPSSSPDGVLHLTPPDVLPHLRWSAGGIAHYAFRPVKREIVPVGGEPRRDFPVAHRVQVDLMFAIGLIDRLELGLVLPVIAWQHEQAEGMTLQPAGLGDPRIEARALLWSGRVLDVGAGLEFTVPLGHYASGGDDFMGYTGPSAQPELLLSAAAGPWLFVVNGGVLLRPMRNTGAYDQRMAGTWSVGVSVDVRDFDEYGGIRIGVENNGEAALGMSSLAQFPLELLATVKYRSFRDLIFSGGAGMGLTDAFGTPLFRLVGGVSFNRILHNCPAGPEDFDGWQDDDKCVDPDNDGDGVDDGADRCPDVAEDMDGFKDEDGCPEYDNDGDGVPDALDRCPLLAEDMDAFEDDDGCPEEGPGRASVEITDSQLLLSSRVYFDYNKADIRPVSYEILDKVAETLENNPGIRHLTVEGHSDNEGTEQYNLELSEQRAQAVVEYLVGKSIPRERLSFKGFGFAFPKASNDSEEGRAINRRVEFKIQLDGVEK